MNADPIIVRWSRTAEAAWLSLPQPQRAYLSQLALILRQLVEQKRAHLVDSSDNLPIWRYRNRKILIEFDLRA